MEMPTPGHNITIGHTASVLRAVTGWVGRALLLLAASISILAVFFIFIFIAKDAFPFLASIDRTLEFFTSTHWYPSNQEPEFGALAIIVGSALVTLGAIVIAVPLGVATAVALSDVVPFSIRQAIKPVIEILTAIPSVAYGFFALVIFAPLLQTKGGPVLAVAVPAILGLPIVMVVLLFSDLASLVGGEGLGRRLSAATLILGLGLVGWIFLLVARSLWHLPISSGTNALNVSIILGIMALPTVISVSEDALQAVGREIREASYALGATRSETIFRAVIPAASSGILTAVILGIMRAIGETMVVWMASGNAAQLPKPWYNLVSPVRTLTATIAGDMGEADHVTGSNRYHVLFAMACCLLIFSFGLNMLAEWAVARQRARLGRA